MWPFSWKCETMSIQPRQVNNDRQNKCVHSSIAYTTSKFISVAYWNLSDGVLTVLWMTQRYYFTKRLTLDWNLHPWSSKQGCRKLFQWESSLPRKCYCSGSTMWILQLSPASSTSLFYCLSFEVLHSKRECFSAQEIGSQLLIFNWYL